MPNAVRPVPKGHHTVPRMLLYRFSDNGFITLVDRLDVKHTRRCSVPNALKINHFYTVDLDDGTRSTAMEQPALSTLDGEAAAAIRQVVDERCFPPPPRSREVLSQFLAYQLVRGEGVRDAITRHEAAVAERMVQLGLELARQATMATSPPQDKHVRQLLDSVRDDFVEDHGREPTRAELRAELRDMKRLKGRWESSNPPLLHITRAFPAAPEVAGYLSARVWRLLTFPEPALLTGDEPVAMVGERPLEVGRPLGVANAAEVVFPVDPSHALVLIRADRGDRDVASAGTPEMARVINRAVAYRCFRWIVHHPAQTPLRGVSIPKPGMRVTTRGAHIALHLSPVSAKYERLIPNARWCRR